MPYRILCIGEILFDVYPDDKRMGGAPFNFAYHLFRMGQSVAFISRIGQDKLGNEIKENLGSYGFPSDFIQVDPEHPTGKVLVELDEHGVPAFDIVPNVAYDFIKPDVELNRLIGSGIDLIYFGTLAQRGITTRQTIHQILMNKPVSTLSFCDVNLRQDYFDKDILQFSLKYSDIVKLSEVEFDRIRDLFKLPSDDSVAGLAMMKQFDIQCLCLTMGEEGSTLFKGERISKINQADIRNVNVIDTVGAGDAFAAMFALGVLNNWQADVIIRRASSFAAAICGIRGAIPTSSEFYRNLAETEGAGILGT